MELTFYQTEQSAQKFSIFSQSPDQLNRQAPHNYGIVYLPLAPQTATNRSPTDVRRRPWTASVN